jgi:hypothetical protein
VILGVVGWLEDAEGWMQLAVRRENSEGNPCEIFPQGTSGCSRLVRHRRINPGNVHIADGARASAQTIRECRGIVEATEV